MAQLDDLIGALMSGLGKGRGQADVATLQIAQIYKGDPLLSHFPIPRMTVDEVTIDLKVAISEVAEAPQPAGMTEAAHGAIMTGVEKIVKDLPKESVFTSLNRTHPSIKKSLKDDVEPMYEHIQRLVPTHGNVDSTTIASVIATSIRGQLSSTLVSAKLGIDSKTIKTLLGTELPKLEGKIRAQVQSIVADALPSTSANERSLKVLATVDELESIPPEKVTTIRLTFKEADRTWVDADTEGKATSKLVPL